MDLENERGQTAASMATSGRTVDGSMCPDPVRVPPPSRREGQDIQTELGTVGKAVAVAVSRSFQTDKALSLSL